MQVKLSSGNYNILDHGNIYLFDESSDLTLNISFAPSFEISVTIRFITDPDEELNINTKKEGNHIFLDCFNFAGEGTGLNTPWELAIFEGKKIYFTFWSYLQGKEDGKKKARKVEYTIYCEK